MSFSPTQHHKHVVKLVVGIAALLLANTALHAAEPVPMNEEQKTLYAIGISVAKSLTVFDLTAAEFEYVKHGLNDAETGKPTDIDPAAYSNKIQDLAKARRKAAGEKQIEAGKNFLNIAAKEKGAVKTTSGMVYKSLVTGKGESPKSTDIVKVNYRGTLINGKEFDSSYKRNKPLEFKLDNVIKCWGEGVQIMKPGGKAKFVCPPNLAYGENGVGDQILPDATLAFDVELLEIKPATAVKVDSSAPAIPAVPPKK